MLPAQAVDAGTLALLKELQALPPLEDFYLVGGTALALRYGHRVSVDLDLFCNQKKDFADILESLKKHFKREIKFEGGLKKIGIFCYVRNIKVDLVYFPHPTIDTFEVRDGMRIYGDKDIAAMKVAAILGRGRKKDFWDIDLLIKRYSIQQIVDWHEQKFQGQMLSISIPTALTYFDDADASEEAVSLIKGQTWEKVKKSITRSVRDYLA